MSTLRGLTKLFKISNRCISYRNLNVTISKKPLISNYLKLCNIPLQDEYKSTHSRDYRYILALNILAWLGFTDDDEKKESELIMTLKRAVLCTQREQFDKAEQMLHLALRIAQQQQNQQGVLYCYDLMANLAMDTSQLDKAEKLFVSVLQMLLSKGMQQDDLKVIHISLKLARISHLKVDNEKAELGYQWCIENIDKHRKHDNSYDAQMLYGVIHDWYAQFLMDMGNTAKSLLHLKEAHRVCKEATGTNTEQSMLLLNDLGITCFRAGQMQNAKDYLLEAVQIGNSLDDKQHVGVVHANLGLILLEQGITKEAEKYCKQAWHLGKKHDNTESVEQANYCFDQIKQSLRK